MRTKLVGLMVAGLLAVTGVSATATSASAVDGRSATRASLGDTLTVKPAYDGFATLTTDSFEYNDGLPSYQFALAEVGTGRPIALGYGYAPESYSGDFESNYAVTTKEPLAVGVEYEAYFAVSTVGFWHCSIYDKDGCSWYEAASSSFRWRFTYTGAPLTASAYTPPPPAAAKTELKLGPKKKWHAHGWKINVSLLGDGAPLAKQRVVGQTRRNGVWRQDNSWLTDRRGRLTIVFDGAERGVSYRFVYRGTKSAEATKTRPFSITGR